MSRVCDLPIYDSNDGFWKSELGMHDKHPCCYKIFVMSGS